MNMNTLLSSATFTANLTIDSDGNVYRFISSYTNGSADAELIGTLADLSDAEYAALAADDRARCVVARLQLA